MSLNEYYSEIRMDIAKEFGIEKAYSPRPKYYITVREAQRLNDKYPAIWEEGAYRPTVNPKAKIIIERLKAIRIANEKKVGNN